LTVICAHIKRVSGICFSNDENYVFSSSWDKTVKQWDTKDSTLIRTFEGHERGVNCVVVGSDDSYLCSGSDDASII